VPGQCGLVSRAVAARAGNNHLTPATRVNVSQSTAEDLNPATGGKAWAPRRHSRFPQPRPHAEP